MNKKKKLHEYSTIRSALWIVLLDHRDRYRLSD